MRYAKRNKYIQNMHTLVQNIARKMSKFSYFSGVGSCNHDRAPIYFAESINSETGFWGFKCTEWKDWALGLCRNSADQALMGWKATNEYVLY